MTNEQGLALARLMRDRPGTSARVIVQPFDLPPGYVEVRFESEVPFVCGIAPDGRVSS